MYKAIKEKFFYFFITSLYVFFLFMVFFINISFTGKNVNATQLKDIYTSDNKLIVTSVLNYVYYLNTKNISEKDLLEGETFIKNHGSKFFKKYKTIEPNRYYFISRSTTPLVDKKQLPKSIICTREYHRDYKYGSIFSQPVGIYNENTCFGLELYNKNVSNKNNVNEPIITTLIFSIQYILYKELKTALEKYNCEKIHGVIQNEKGEILGIISLPSFDPSINYQTPKNTMNGVIQSTFEFGSIIKLFIFFLGVHKDFVTMDTTFNIMEYALIGEHKIRDVNIINKSMSLEEILMRSSNVGVIHLSEIIWPYIGDFYKEIKLGDSINFNGFNTPGVAINYEGGPKYLYQHYTMGYSFRVTMLQVLRAFIGIITNAMYNPSIIQEKQLTPIKTLDIKNKDSVLEVLLKISKKDPVLKNYKVYGKTGTSRVVINGKYIKNCNNTFYLCMFEKNGKKYFMLITSEKPQSKKRESFGNTKLVAGEIIRKIMKTNL